MKKKTDRGFSLIELIIAIAILIILTGLLAPQFMKYIEKSRKAACLNNVDVMIKEYQVAMIDNPDITPEEVLKTMVEHGMKCPSKGIYTVKKASDGETFSVNCSVHGNIGGGSTDLSIVAAETVYNAMMEFQNLSLEEIRNIIETSSAAGNTQIRQYLLDKKYGGSWPELEQKYIYELGYSGKLYIQPYLNEKLKPKEVIAYAGPSPDNKNKEPWAAYCIYSYEEKCWYKAPINERNQPIKYNMTDNKSWAEIKDYMENNGWKKIQ